MKIIEMMVDGKVEKVWAVKSKGVLWFHWRGQTHAVAEDLTSGKRGRQAQVSTHPGRILAPMPGRVIKVAVKMGQRVSIGDVVVVMEAMKMEYSLTADISGVVAKANCQSGQQVALGTELIEIRAANEN